MTKIMTKRIYETPARHDGFRVLVDRVWPRGVSKDRAMVDLWLTEVAPSTTLRKWFRHDPQKWEEFKQRYFVELESHSEAVARLLERANKGNVTLVYSAKDTVHNQAVALYEYLRKCRSKGAC